MTPPPPHGHFVLSIFSLQFPRCNCGVFLFCNYCRLPRTLVFRIIVILTWEPLEGLRTPFSAARSVSNPYVRFIGALLCVLLFSPFVVQEDFSSSSLHFERDNKLVCTPRPFLFILPQRFSGRRCSYSETCCTPILGEVPGVASRVHS